MAESVRTDKATSIGQENSWFIYSFLPGLLFVLLLWLISLLSYLSEANLVWLGIQPRNFFGLVGVVTGPLIHGDLLHLLSNSFPLVLLSGFILFLHRKTAFKIIVLVYILSGLLTWFIGRPSFHIGASGVVYGLAGFLLFNGFMRQDRSSLAVSMAVLFMYSGLFYGLVPTEERVSWEGHLSGFIAGAIAVIVYGDGFKKTQKETYLSPSVVQKHVSNTIGVNYRHLNINYQIKPQETQAGKIHYSYIPPLTKPHKVSSKHT